MYLSVSRVFKTYGRKFFCHFLDKVNLKVNVKANVKVNVKLNVKLNFKV